MPWKISSKAQILFLSSIGVYRTIKEFYNQNLEEVWQIQLSDNLSQYYNFLTSVISGIILIREFTGHLYIASYFLILYPILMGKMRSALLLWMFVSGLRSVLLNLGVAIIGIVLCSSHQEFNFACFKFVAEEALELGCSIYMWTVVNDYYHSLKKVSVRSHYQSPLNSPNTSEIVEDTSSSFLSDEWSLPLSLVEEFQKSTKENLLESATKTTTDSVKNLRSKSVDSLLAQAMVDWFIKKIVKIKPKEENETSSPTKLSDMNSNDVATLRKRIKKSIADIDKSDIKDLLASNQSIKNQTTCEPATGDKGNEEHGTEEKVERIVTRENIEPSKDSELQIQNIPEELTSGNKSSHSRESDKLPDFICNVNRTQLNITDCYIANQSNSNLVDIKNIQDNNLKEIKLHLEPMNAVNLVKRLFEDSFESTIDKTLKNKSFENKITIRNINNDDSLIRCFNKLTAKDKMNQSEYDFDQDLFESKTSFDLNEKALDCSFVIVKSLLEDAIDNAIDITSYAVKKESADGNIDNTTQAKNNTASYENCRIIKLPLKDSNAGINSDKRFGIQKKISFLDELKKSVNISENSMPIFGVSYKSELTNIYAFPERVRSVLKSVNMERISRKSDKFRKTKKPYNKENEFESRLSYKVRDKNTTEPEMSIKALRYHFRRSNPTKVPIKRSKETILSQKSLKSIIEGIKQSDKKNIKSTDIPGSSGLQYNHQSLLKRYSPNHKITRLKDTSAQTITTKQLLKKIREAEEEDSSI